MKKSILVLILSIVFILAACGNQSNNSQSDSKSEKNESKDTVKRETIPHHNSCKLRKLQSIF